MGEKNNGEIREFPGISGSFQGSPAWERWGLLIGRTGRLKKSGFMRFPSMCLLEPGRPPDFPRHSKGLAYASTAVSEY